MSDDETATSSGNDQPASQQPHPATTQSFNTPRSGYPRFPHLTQPQIQQQFLNDGRNGYGVLKTCSSAFESSTQLSDEVFS